VKKGLAILVLISYVLCAFSVTFSFHHCRGEFKYVSLDKGKHEKKCCKGKKKMPKGCCNSSNVTFKKSDDRSQSYFIIAKKFVDPVYAIVSFPITGAEPTIAHSSTTDCRLRPRPPERGRGEPLYLLFSTFLI
jgi:hypothetical protein